jgi:hypothetical protein
MKHLFLLIALLAFSGCGTSNQFDVASPITVRSGTFGDSYEQRSAPLDQKDMVDKLGERPATKADVEAARTYATIGMIFGAVGGALIGWPIGAAAAGQSNPHWVLAGVGAGVVAVSIPFSIGASGRISDAVKTHNNSLKPVNSEK